jgi:5-(carboxyamino)imidazole ribonucleotide mutase
MSKPLVVILMGSKADLEHCTKISDACMGFGLEVVLRIASAHKTPEHAIAILKEYEANARPKVYITVAGRSNALSGFTCGCLRGLRLLWCWNRSMRHYWRQKFSA